ncbi:5'-nucleotidase [Mucilaginibacter gynuensis]|uniref:5'-nucleotidase n=1 Tax=Mucilaginibacter gynuensis TaxID=1302236 RepID=A0ABP8GHA6_9SPHI
MPYPIEKKLVVGVSSNALFDLEIEDKIFEEQGVKKYREYQIANKAKMLKKGVAFPFIKRFLNINNVYTSEQPVEVVLLSKNSPETGIRIFNSIKHYNLNISRAAFLSGISPYNYIPAYNISLFLTTNKNDANLSIEAGYPAGIILKTKIEDDEEDLELRVAFDFDGVIADDQAETVYQKTNDLEQFHEFETKNILQPHNSGPLADFFKKLGYFQKLESKKFDKDNTYKKILRTSIVTARNAPSHERAINTLKKWDVTVDDMFLMGGIEKSRVLSVLKPHLFLDDQLTHLDVKLNLPLVHIPFGIINTVTKL